MNASIGLLWDKVYSLRGDFPYPSREASQSFSDNLESILIAINQLENQDGEASLLRAYVAYHFPCELTSKVDIEDELIRVLSVNPENTTARLYLAHYYYDSRRFSESLTALNSVDRKAYENIGQLWRSLKILELTICSKLYLSLADVKADEIMDLCDMLEQAGSEDAAVPSELAEAMLANKSELVRAWGSENLASVVNKLRRTISQVSLEGTLKDKLDSLIR